MNLRDHEPVVIDKFNGLWARGDADNTPMDHFQDCNNIRFIGSSSFGTRYGIDINQSVGVPLQNIKRIYNYPTQTGNTLIVLVTNGTTGFGEIYHVVDAATVFGPLLSIDGMTDFAFIPYAGRAYISPFSSLPPVTPAPSQILALELTAGTDIDSGIHQYAFTYVTGVGETIPSPLASITTNTSPLADPLIAPVISNIGVGTNGLNAGQNYRWAIIYELNSVLTTLQGPDSNTIVAVANRNYGLELAIASIPAAAVNVAIYRTAGNGLIFHLEVAGQAKANIPSTGSGSYLSVGVMTDAVLLTQPIAPLANNTTSGNVNISNIAVGNDDVVSRNVYRTVAGGTQLKLLTTIPDNVTTIFLDAQADSTLGVNAPIVNTAITTGLNTERGLPNEFLYVYAGDGTAARKAAGNPLSGFITVANGAPGHTDPGFHLFTFVAETISGYLTAPPIAGFVAGFNTVATNSVSFGNIPTSGDPNIVRRHLIATKVIPTYNGDSLGYQFFFVPGGTINNNTDTFLNNVSFFDQDLLEDASHLLDNYSEIPAGAVLTLYHNRLVLCTTYDNISIGLVSAVGEPEAISQIDGFVVVVPDGNPITNAQELRDILYVFKRSKTVSFTDNGDEPSTWPLITVDNALGTFVHGIATVLDSGSSSIDFLIVCTYQGITLFNGRYISPELSWKIEDFWRNQERANFKAIQIINAPIQKEILCILPDRSLLIGNYANGFDPMKIRWTPVSFIMGVNTIAIANIDEVILGADVNP